MKTMFKKGEHHSFMIKHNDVIHTCYVNLFKGRMTADKDYKPELSWFTHKNDKDWCLIGLYNGKYHVTGFDFQFVADKDSVNSFVAEKDFDISI